MEPVEIKYGKESPKASGQSTNPLTDPHAKGPSDEEFRQTWKMKPKISKKLPSAFSSMPKPYIYLFSIFSHSGKKDSLPKPEKKVGKLDSIKDAIDAEEFKQVQSLLTPIVVDNQRREEMQKGLNKIYEQPASGYPKKVTKLEPLDSSTQNRKEEDKKKMHPKHHAVHPHAKSDPKKDVDLGIKKTTVQSSQVKLEEMITLSILKGTRNSGSVKKMLHAPSLKLYAVKEIPLSNREVRIVLKEWISMWQTSQSETADKIANIHGTFWNVPEGCVSVVMEYMNAGSLENLLESAGALPEQVLLELATKLLSCIQEIHDKIHVPHGCIMPSQVLFDQKGQIKLNLGVAYRLNIHQKDMGTGSFVYFNNPNSGSGETPFR